MSGWSKRFNKHAFSYGDRVTEKHANIDAGLDPKRVKYTRKAIENLSYEQAHEEAERIIAEYGLGSIRNRTIG